MDNSFTWEGENKQEKIICNLYSFDFSETKKVFTSKRFCDYNNELAQHCRNLTSRFTKPLVVVQARVTYRSLNKTILKLQNTKM